MTWQTIGFEKIKKYFTNAIEGNTPAQAELAQGYLFTGQEQIGKRTFALELVPLLQSHSAQGLLNPDLLIIDPAESESGYSISIGEVRKIKSFLSLHAHGGTRKIAIINDAHTMTDEAQNGLLKVLEEPSATSMFILITAFKDHLLSTVRSRCQEVQFPPHPRSAYDITWQKEKLSDAQKDFLFSFSHGRIGLVLEIIRDKSVSEIKKAAQELTQLMQADLNGRIEMVTDWVEPRRSGRSPNVPSGKNRAILEKKALYWLLYIAAKARTDTKLYNIARGLLKLYDILRQPQFSAQLAFEEFVINL